MLESGGGCWAGEGMRRKGEAWPELVVSGFDLNSTWCQRCVSEQTRAPCAPGVGDNCSFKSPCHERGGAGSPKSLSSHRLALSCVPGASPGCYLLYAACVTTVTGNLSGIRGG